MLGFGGTGCSGSDYGWEDDDDATSTIDKCTNNIIGFSYSRRLKPNRVKIDKITYDNNAFMHVIIIILLLHYKPHGLARAYRVIE